MKIKLLLALATIMTAAQFSAAQEKQSSLRAAFETWNQARLSAAEKSSSEFSYFAAVVQKSGADSALINFGITGFTRNFEVSVTPLRYEKAVDGKWNITEFPVAGNLRQLSDEPTSGEFAEPQMQIRVAPEANAVRLSLRIDGEKAVKTLVLNLSETSSNGVLASL